MQISSGQTDIPTIDPDQVMATSEYNELFKFLADSATGRPSPAKIAALPEKQKDAVTQYLIHRKRPIIAGFVTHATQPGLLAGLRGWLPQPLLRLLDQARASIDFSAYFARSTHIQYD